MKNRSQDTQAWRDKNPERAKKLNRKIWLKQRYNLTIEEYDQMMAAQNHQFAMIQNQSKNVNFQLIIVIK